MKSLESCRLHCRWGTAEPKWNCLCFFCLAVRQQLPRAELYQLKDLPFNQNSLGPWMKTHVEGPGDLWAKEEGRARLSFPAPSTASLVLALAWKFITVWTIVLPPTTYYERQVQPTGLVFPFGKGPTTKLVIGCLSRVSGDQAECPETRMF